MMRQYHEAKAACGDALLLFRMGDFYELFFEDAKIAARELGLTLTSRDKDSDNPTPMAGFPHHQLDSYLRRLILAGFRAAVCEQVEDPKQAKGIVRREVTRVVSAGTLTDDQLLVPQEANYLAAVYQPVAKKQDKNGVPLLGIAWAELSSGRFEAGVFPADRLEDELARIAPAEVLLPEDDVQLRSPALQQWNITRRPAWTFGADESLRVLLSHFKAHSLEGFGFNDEHRPAVQAAGAVMAYLKETQSCGLAHFERLTAYHQSPVMQIDAATRRSLELTRTLRTGERSGSLLSVIDHTVSPMGARRLADWLSAPLLDRATISQRQAAVGELLQRSSLRDSIRSQIREMFDLARLLGRIATGRCTPRDLLQVGCTLASLPKLRELLAERDSVLLRELQSQISPCQPLREQLQRGLVDDCPMTTVDGGFIREGFDAELDALRELANGGKQWIARYQAEQIQVTGITSLKVGFTKVFGYYLEVTNTHREKIPPHFIRKQTLKNCERYITDELKQYEEKVLAADEQAKDREVHLFGVLRDACQAELHSLRTTAEALAQLDAIAGLAELAARGGYVRPELVDEPMLEIEEGRHPVLDAVLARGEFVPNDCFASPEHGMLLLITGPNMAGKSTYIRQVALLTILAQVGSYVPAKRAVIGVADRVFARVGASDELSRGQSTFMVEMVETARILNTATPRSLLILDEIGRGTSTYDGLSLAWAICEHIHEQIGARTLFATHYHELTQLSDTMPRVTNLNVAVKEWDDQVVFLHRIVPGGADKSYGIHVARLAGIPGPVNERAKEILAQLEDAQRDRYDQPKIQPPTPRRSAAPMQLTLFGFADHPVLDELRKPSLDTLTPEAALELVQRLRDRLHAEPPVGVHR